MRDRLEMRVAVGEYRGYIVVEALKPEEKADVFYPAGGSRIGCVLLDTRKHLGISKRAYALMTQVRRGHDDLGDLDAFETRDKRTNKLTGKWCFAWIGPVINCINSAEAETARDCDMYRLPHNTIRNYVRSEVKRLIDAKLEVKIK